MSLTRAIAGNTLAQVAGKFAATLFGILTVAIMTRCLGRDGYGQFTTATSFLQFFGILADFGLMLTLVRMLARPNADEQRTTANVFTLRLTLAVVSFGAAAIIGALVPYPPIVKIAIAVGSLSYLLMSLGQLLVGVFQKNLAAGRAAIAEVAGRAVLLAAVAAVAWRGYGLVAIVACLVAGNLVQFLLSVFLARRFVRIQLSFEPKFWLEIAKESWPIGVSIIFNLVYLKGDVIIMSFTRTEAEIGLYGAAYKILDVVTVIPMIFMGMVMPVLAASWQAGRADEFRRRLARAFDATSLLAIPLAVGTFTVADDLMTLVAGRAFAGSGNYLVVLMLAGAAVFWSGLFGHSVVALGKQRLMTWGYAVDAAISLALYLVFIPKFGAVAAAWVTFFSEAFIAIATAAVVLVVSKVRLSLAVPGRALLAALLMTGAVLAASSLHVVFRVLLAFAAYTAGLWLFRAVDRATLKQLLS